MLLVYSAAPRDPLEPMTIMYDLTCVALLGSSVIEWILLAIGLGCGLFLGMLWARRSGANSMKQSSSLESAQMMAEDNAAAVTDNALSALEELHTLASCVRADVGQHSDQVEEINRELTSGDASGPAVSASLSKLLEANQKLQAQLDSAEEKLESQAHEIEKTAADARTDALTQITNRRGFDDFMNRRVAEWQRRARPFCLLMMDVDHFKKFNDTHGHQAGDEVLRRVAASLTETSREMDFVTRYGGEEFAVIMSDCVASEALAACDRMREAIEETMISFEGKSLSVTVSQGLAEVTPADDVKSIINRADEALYASKSAGRNCGHLHDGGGIIGFQDVQLPSPKTEEQGTSEEESVPTPAPQQEVVAAERQSKLPGRDIFQAELDRRIAESHRRGGELTILLIEVDEFEAFEQRFGDATAAKVFDTVGDFLGASFRKMDMIARADDSQFAAMLPGTHLHAAAQIAGRMQDAIAKCKIPMGGEEVTLTVSVGMAELSANDDAASLLQRAEDALQSSRAMGPNHAHAHTTSGSVSLAEVVG